jgi:hypothetical protein
MHRQRLGVQLDSGDLRVQFPGAIVLIVIGVLCGIGVGVFQGSRSGDEVGGSGERLAIRGVGGWRWSGRVARPDRELQIGIPEGVGPCQGDGEVGVQVAGRWGLCASVRCRRGRGQGWP